MILFTVHRFMWFIVWTNIGDRYRCRIRLRSCKSRCMASVRNIVDWRGNLWRYYYWCRWRIWYHSQNCSWWERERNFRSLSTFQVTNISVHQCSVKVYVLAALAFLHHFFVQTTNWASSREITLLVMWRYISEGWNYWLYWISGIFIWVMVTESIHIWW